MIGTSVTKEFKSLRIQFDVKDSREILLVILNLFKVIY